MKKEGKSIRNLMIGILVLVMTMALMAGCTEQPTETTAPQETEAPAPVVKDYDLYYCKAPTQALKLDTDKTYHVALYNKGLAVTARVADEATAKQVLLARIFAVEKDAAGIVTGVKSVADVGGNLVAAECYISHVGDKAITVTTGKDGAGFQLGTFEFADKCVITDVTGTTAVGATPTMRVNDVLYAVANAEGKLTHIFLTVRAYETVSAACPHCDKTVTWNIWDGDNGKLPTAAGHWKIGKDYTSTASTIAAADVVVDLNGHTVKVASATQGYILNNAATKLTILDTSKEQTGAIIANGGADLTASYGLIEVAKAKAVFNLLSGTIDGSNINATQVGAVVYVIKGGIVNIEGGKIVGGTTVGGLNETTGADIGGRGGAILIKAGGIVNVSGGEIVGGKAIRNTSLTSNAHGGAIYVEKTGKLNVSGGKISGGTAELGGNCVYILQEADLVQTGGEIESVEVKK